MTSEEMMGGRKSIKKKKEVLKLKELQECLLNSIMENVSWLSIKKW